jgi:hypothetical protein
MDNSPAVFLIFLVPLMVCCMFLFIGGIFGAVIYMAARTNKEMAQGWADFGLRSGMAFTKGDFFKVSRLDGEYRHRPAVITHFTRGSSKHSRTYMTISLTLASPPQAAFNLFPAGHTLDLGKLFGSPMQDVQIGTPEFDNDFVIQGQPPEYISNLLGPDLTLQDLIRQLKSQWFTRLVLQNGVLIYTQYSIETSADTLEQLIALTSDIADKIEGREKKF